MARCEFAAFTKSQTFSIGRKSRGVQQQMWKKRQEVLGGVRNYGLRRQMDGHKVYRRVNWSVRARVGSAEFRQDETRIAAAWVALSPEERALWKGQGVAESSAIKNLTDGPGGVASMDDINAASSTISGGKSAALKQAAVADVVELIKQHPAWSDGLGIYCMSSAMKDTCVLFDKTNVECEQLVKAHFRYDDIIVKNPTGAMTVPRLPCALATWRLCQKILILEHCKNGTENLYQLMKQRKIGRKDFPMALTIKI